MIKLNPAVDSGDWYQVFFANVYKVQCFNADEGKRVLDTWDHQLKGKETPGKMLPWTIYDYMDASSYTLYTFMAQVQAAISASYSSTKTLGCQGGPAAHCSTETTTIYGGAVNVWLSGNHGLGGFIIGPSTGNTFQSYNGGGGGGSSCGCFIPGTPILMSDGSTKAIEHVQPGDAVISRNGEICSRSPQDVRWPIEQHELLYGINEYPPFFNASHPFMTTGGWKSMSPVASQRINPDLVVAQLQEGDVLVQADGDTPLHYREVPITEITKMLARDAPSLVVHSLHLEQDNPGYHAHGFLVAVNYPQLREDHFLRAFKGVTEAERVYLRTHFEALAPFLRRGLGNYISEILRRALGASGEKLSVGEPIHEVEHF